jgi:hypothetical protein
MYTRHKDRKEPPTRSFLGLLLAWLFIGGQALLVAGTVYNYRCADTQVERASVTWEIMGQSAVKMRAMATPAEPDTINGIIAFFVVADALGLAALLIALFSWSTSGHVRGRLTIAAAVIIVAVNALLNLPYLPYV